jgi:dTDP-4-dehydrorhamnose reductase
MKALITGANGQLGGALQHQFPDALALGSKELDITDPKRTASRQILRHGRDH